MPGKTNAVSGGTTSNIIDGFCRFVTSNTAYNSLSAEDKQTIITNFKSSLASMESANNKIYKLKVTTNTDGSMIMGYEETTSANFPIIFDDNAIYFGVDQVYLDNGTINYLINATEYPTWKVEGTSVTPIQQTLYSVPNSTEALIFTATFGNSFQYTTGLTMAPCPALRIVSVS